MASLRDLRKRVRAVKNTQKITKAMKMVAASKLRRAQQAIVQARPYATRMADMLEHIVGRVDVSAHPLLELRRPRRVLLVVVTSDRGLCGSFNSNMIRTAERFMTENAGKYDEIRVAAVGKKARDHFRRRGAQLETSYDRVWSELGYERATEIATDIAERFEGGRFDAIYLLYNEFKSAISQHVRLRQVLPIRSIEGWEADPQVRIGELAAISGDPRAVAGRSTELVSDPAAAGFVRSERLEVEQAGYEHVYEPSRDDILETLLPQHIAVQIWRALLESSASEHGARMSAMDAASRNAKELIGKLSLEANRVRQASITKELMEIVSGAETLKA
jgi:F-type H+-transporting ATPase subunit gamma